MARKLRDNVPALQQGAKIFPNDIAGFIGLPDVGNIFYVDAGSGSDANNNGASKNEALSTVFTAQAKMVAGQDDVVVMVGSNSTGRTSETSVIDWDARRTHLVGNGPLRKINPRNGLAFGAGLSTGFTVSANDCSFTNVSIATFEDNNVLVDVTAPYNNFNYVHFQGIGNSDAGDDAAARSLVITGADETEVNNCTIGLDTITRSTTNASLELTGTCARTKIINCDFPMFADNSGARWITANTGNCYERFLIIQGCNFFNPTNASSTNLTVGLQLSATGNGDIYFLDNTWRGATDLASDYTNLYSNIPIFDGQDAGVVKIITT